MVVQLLVYCRLVEIKLFDGTVFVSYVIRPIYVVVLQWAIKTCTIISARAKELEARAICQLENFSFSR